MNRHLPFAAMLLSGLFGGLTAHHANAEEITSHSTAASTATDTQCTLDIEVGDNMVYTPASITVSQSACPRLTINLTHVGKLPAKVMGHNWVLSTSADAQDLAQDGWSHGLDNNYLPPNDPRTIVTTKMLGGGESDSITLDLTTLDVNEDYTFFCSFLGHYTMLMRGPFVLTQ